MTTTDRAGHEAQSAAMLYKLYPLETTQQLSHLIRAIQFGEIWAGAPSAFNDPFDCKPRFDRGIDSVDSKQYFSWLIREKHGQLNESEVERRAAELAERFSTGDIAIHQEAERIEKTWLERLHGGVGVACFSKSCSNVLMWSHYASKHMGACIEIPDNVELFKGHSLVSVNYESDDRPVVRLFDHDGSGESATRALELCFTRKAKSWAYEQERRAIRSDGPGLLYMPEGAVKAVTLGAHMEDAMKAIVIHAARRSPSPVHVYQARLSDKTYRIERDPVQL